MKYELKTIETYIKDLKPGPITDENGNGPGMPTLKKDIEAEIDRIKKAFIENAFKFKEKKVERYIQEHQAMLISLCNELTPYISPEKNNNTRGVPKCTDPGNLAFIYTRLGGLLTFIESHFSKYFNQNETIPVHYQVIGQKEFREKLKAIPLKGGCRLVGLALYPVKEFIEQDVKITFRKLIYYKALLNEVKNTCPSCNQAKPVCKLCYSLVYLNFNSHKFYNFITSTIKEEYLCQKTSVKKIEKLSFYLKKINQTHEKPNIAYKTKYAPIKTQLTDWLLEEMSHLEKVRQLNLFTGNPARENKSTFKIIVDTSVSQLALLIRLLKEIQLIKNKNLTGVFEFFSSYFETKGSADLSPGSFRSKFYKTDENTKSFIKETLIKLLNQVQKEK